MSGQATIPGAGGRDDTPVAPRIRFLAALAAWMMIALGQPGLFRHEGFGHMAFVALAPWALVCCRPGRRAFLAEWAAAALGLAAIFLWMRHLLPWVLFAIAVIPAIWVALGGFALRRLARRYPLALAAPAAWMAAELVRWHLPAPLSFGWWRLGTFAHDDEWMVGSARVWGVWGLTWVFAAFGGWLADLWRTRHLAPGEAPRHRLLHIHLLGLGPMVLAMILNAVVTAPETRPGPRVLLVQPGTEQRLKMGSDDVLNDLFGDLCTLTAEGLASVGTPAPDLVCWGESMLPFNLLEEGTLEAFRRGDRWLSFADQFDEQRLLDWQLQVESLVQGLLCGQPEALAALARRASLWRGVLRPTPWLDRALAGQSLLPPGTAFVTGVVTQLPYAGTIRARNAAALWDSTGRLRGTAGKVHLVPVAEDPYPWMYVPGAIAALHAVGGYVPDLVADSEPGVLEFDAPGRGPWRMAVGICYDNVFDDPFITPLRAGEVDFFLVLSNEAWYEDSLEMDHMLAAARLRAVSSGRSVVRATNSGISAVIDPAGEILAVLEDQHGRRKMVRGTLAATVPVPLVERGAERGPRTLWVLSAPWQVALWALGLALLIFRAGRPVTRPQRAGSGESDAAPAGSVEG